MDNDFSSGKVSGNMGNKFYTGQVSGKRVGMAEIIVMLHSNSTSKIFNVQIHPITVEFSCKLEIIRKCLRVSTVEIIVLLRSNSTSKFFLRSNSTDNGRIQL